MEPYSGTFNAGLTIGSEEGIVWAVPRLYQAVYKLINREEVSTWAWKYWTEMIPILQTPYLIPTEKTVRAVAYKNQ